MAIFLAFLTLYSIGGAIYGEEDMQIQAVGDYSIFMYYGKK
jgi:hypothetical protein